jgi:hypothetical protein
VKIASTVGPCSEIDESSTHLSGISAWDLARAQRRLWIFMASKTKVTPQKEEMLEKEGRETPPGSPLLDLSDAAVKKLIRSAKKRGYVTHDQINALLSSEEVKSEQIEDILAKFSEKLAKVRTSSMTK